MHVYMHFFGLSIPSYGLMIVIGTFIANVIGFFLVKKEKKNFDDFILVEAYCILGGFIGAKLLYFIVSFNDIEWNRFFEKEYMDRPFNLHISHGLHFHSILRRYYIPDTFLLLSTAVATAGLGAT